jgi:hypothetical protein
MDQNQYIIETIVRMLLDTNGATVALIDKVWETWTPEQRKFFADKAYDIAQEKMPNIISKTFYDVRGGYNNDPLSTSIRRKLDDAFKSGKIGDQIDESIEREVSYWRKSIPADVERAVEKLINHAFRVSIGRVDLDDIMGYVKKDKGTT